MADNEKLSAEEMKQLLHERITEHIQEQREQERAFLVNLALTFDFCNAEERTAVYHVLCKAWDWGKRVS